MWTGKEVNQGPADPTHVSAHGLVSAGVAGLLVCLTGVAPDRIVTNLEDANPWCWTEAQWLKVCAALVED